MNYCPNCGTEKKGNFCTSCGFNLSQRTNDLSSKVSEPEKILAVMSSNYTEEIDNNKSVNKLEDYKINSVPTTEYEVQTSNIVDQKVKKRNDLILNAIKTKEYINQTSNGKRVVWGVVGLAIFIMILSNIDNIFVNSLSTIFVLCIGVILIYLSLFINKSNVKNAKRAKEILNNSPNIGIVANEINTYEGRFFVKSFFGVNLLFDNGFSLEIPIESISVISPNIIADKEYLQLLNSKNV